MLGRARRGGYVSAASLGDLDRQVPDAAAGSHGSAPAGPPPPGRCPPGACHAVRPASGKRGGFGVGQAGGLAGKLTKGAATYSAYALAARGKNGMPYTSSPGWNRVTPGSMSSTTPLMSQPRMNGRLAQQRETARTGSPLDRVYPPARTRTSIRWAAAPVAPPRRGPQHLRTAEGLLAESTASLRHRDSSVPDRRGSLGTTLGGR